MKFSTPEDKEDLSLLNKHRTSEVEEAKRTQQKAKCDFDCQKQIMTILIFLILVVLGKI